VKLYLHSQYVFMVWYLVKHREDFTFIIINHIIFKLKSKWFYVFYGCWILTQPVWWPWELYANWWKLVWFHYITTVFIASDYRLVEESVSWLVDVCTSNETSRTWLPQDLGFSWQGRFMSWPSGWGYRQHDPLKWYSIMSLHSVTTQSLWLAVNIAVW